MRITRPQMFMEIAHVVAKRATCMRLSVGAVLVRERSIVAIGYNGVAAGAPHCTGNDCPGRDACTLTTHAEINALQHLPRGTSGPLDIYCTDSPCERCYLQILEDGRIGRIFFAIPYRVADHLQAQHFDLGGPQVFVTPQVYRITPSGYVMNWRTKMLEEVET